MYALVVTTTAAAATPRLPLLLHLNLARRILFHRTCALCPLLPCLCIMHDSVADVVADACLAHPGGEQTRLVGPRLA